MTELNHIVLLKVRDDAPMPEVERTFAAIRDLRHEIDGVLEVSIGPDASIEGLANGYTHGLIVRFADEAARDRYLPHPAHEDVAKRLQPLLEGLAIVDIVAP